MKLLRAIFILFTPSVLLRLIKTDTFSIGKNSRIGFSLIISNNFHIGDNCSLGHFNFIHVDSFVCGENGFIGYLNIIRGHIDVKLGTSIEIFKQNKISAPMFNIAPSKFVMFDSARIAVKHVLDLTHNITIGRGVCIAGLGSQFWTHAFYYSQSSFDRIRVDKPIVIGDHCYIGSSVIVCAGVKICDGVTVGAGTCVVKDLMKPGLYVSSAIRHVEKFNADELIQGMGDEQYRTDYAIYHS